MVTIASISAEVKTEFIASRIALSSGTVCSLPYSNPNFLFTPAISSSSPSNKWPMKDYQRGLLLHGIHLTLARRLFRLRCQSSFFWGFLLSCLRLTHLSMPTPEKSSLGSLCFGLPCRPISSWTKISVRPCRLFLR